MSSGTPGNVTTLAVRAPDPKPKATPKARTKKKSKDGVMHTVGELVTLHHMSPHFNTLIPALTHQGRAFPYTGVVRADITMGVLDTIVIAATNVGIAGTVLSFAIANGAGAPVFTTATIPTISAADFAGGPTSARSMKFSLGLSCTTPLLSRGGRVSVLNGQSRLRIDLPPSTMTAAVFGAIVTSIRGMPNTQIYDNTHFGETREMSGSVVDSVTYEDFEEFVGTETTDEFWEHIAVWPGSVRRDRPMSTAWIVISPPAFQQTYTVSVKAAYYTRWGLSTVPGQSQIDIPTAPASIVNRIQALAHTMADTLHTVAEIGANASQYAPHLVAAADYLAPMADAIGPRMLALPLV